MTLDVNAAVLDVDVAVVGGGSAGLAAACAAKESGADTVLVIERDAYLGGVLPQCVHDGFGLYAFGENVTGPEYAWRWEQRARECGVRFALEATVLDIAAPDAASAVEPGRFALDVVGASLGGRVTVRAKSVVVATGCRERTRGAMQIVGTRPTGVLTAGSAQYMVNVANLNPGDKVVILGSGDIGLIMARRMTLEGADVRLVLGQKATGLVRNHIRCIEDFGIPIRYGWGLVSIHGHGQLKGVTVAPLLEDGTPDLARREYVRCNVLLIACGLIPEQEVLSGVEDWQQTPGLFVCGNAKVPHDLVDQVSQEGIGAGLAAASYAAGKDMSVNLPRDLARMARKRIQEPTGRMADESDELAPGETRIVCTVCPSGCVMTASADGQVRGNTCERGREFAQAELACPKRMFTGTIKISGAKRPLLPVRTDGEVPKDSLMAVARACRRLKATAPVTVGQVVAANVAGTGVDLIATLGMDAAEPGVRAHG